MPSSTIRRLAVVLATAVASSLLATGPVGNASTASGQPDGDGFLLVDDLPADPTWVAGDIQAGEPEIEEFCVGEVITPPGTRHRPYWTELDTFARQHITTRASEAKAEKLQRRLDRAMRGCAEEWEQESGGEATFRKYGRFATKDGVKVYGVFTEETFGALSANLFAVGRDGTAVTVVRYGRIGRESDVPVRAFERTARRAVDTLTP